MDQGITNILENKFLAWFFSRIDKVAENIAERIQSCCDVLQSKKIFTLNSLHYV